MIQRNLVSGNRVNNKRRNQWVWSHKDTDKNRTDLEVAISQKYHGFLGDDSQSKMKLILFLFCNFLIGVGEQRMLFILCQPKILKFVFLIFKLLMMKPKFNGSYLVFLSITRKLNFTSLLSYQERLHQGSVFNLCLIVSYLRHQTLSDEVTK